MLIDSNIVIYASQPEHAELRRFIAEQAPAVSAVSYVEVLGYQKLDEGDRKILEAFFAAAIFIPLDDEVLSEAVRLRQLRKMTLGDALVAATALVAGRTLVTRNTRDFAWVPNLEVLNPFIADSRFEQG